jgi:hypothetical protein
MRVEVGPVAHASFPPGQKSIFLEKIFVCSGLKIFQNLRGVLSPNVILSWGVPQGFQNIFKGNYAEIFFV